MEFKPEDVQNVWNANRGDLPSCNDLTILARRVKATALLKKLGDDVPNLERIAQAVRRIANSQYCLGLVGGENPFIASFDWFLNPEILIQIEEARFDGPKYVIGPESGKTSPKDLSYWNKPKPEAYNPTPEQFFRNQVAGRLALRFERRMRVQYLTNHLDGQWIDEGGPHHWASPEQVAAAEAEVKFLREGAMEDRNGELVRDPRNKLPSSFDEAVGRMGIKP